jgi:hypothetical protein
VPEWSFTQFYISKLAFVRPGNVRSEGHIHSNGNVRIDLVGTCAGTLHGSFFSYGRDGIVICGNLGLGKGFHDGSCDIYAYFIIGGFAYQHIITKLFDLAAESDDVAIETRFIGLASFLSLARYLPDIFILSLGESDAPRVIWGGFFLLPPTI